MDEGNPFSSLQLSSLPHEKSLRRWVHTHLKTEYRELATESTLSKVGRWLQCIIVSPTFIALVLFGVLTLVNEFLVSRNIVMAVYDLDANSAGETMTSFIDTVVASIGILIPLVILLLEFLGRNSSVLIKIYFERTGIVQAATLALITAGVLVTIKFYLLSGTPLNLAAPDKQYFYLVLLTLLITGSLLVTIGHLIRAIPRSVSTESSIRFFLDSLRKQIRISQHRQISYRYSRIAQVNFAKNLNLQRLLLSGRPGRFTTVPLVAPKTGYIVDINPSKWVQLHEFFQPASTIDHTRGFVAKLVGDYVVKGDAIMYVLLAKPTGIWKWIYKWQTLYDWSVMNPRSWTQKQ